MLEAIPRSDIGENSRRNHRLADWSKELIERVETVIDEQRSDKHEQICRKIEGILDSDVKMEQFVKKKLQGKEIDQTFLEFGYPINVQSGGNYNLKMGNPPTQMPLTSDTVLLSVCGKYKDLCCNCSRTLLIGP